jgi:hypothetical protein
MNKIVLILMMSELEMSMENSSSALNILYPSHEAIFLPIHIFITIMDISSSNTHTHSDIGSSMDPHPQQKKILSHYILYDINDQMTYNNNKSPINLTCNKKNIV